MEASDADAAIANFTSSNAMNVFIGLGLPWVIATIYASAKGRVYQTPAKSLTYSVVVFLVRTICVFTQL